MSWQWNPWALVPLTATLISLALAWLVYAAHPRRTQNRALTIVLVCQGLGLATLAARLTFNDLATSYALLITWYAVWMVGLLATVRFYGTLPGPLARPLRTRTATRLGAAVTAAFVGAIALRPALAMASMQHVAWLDVWLGFRPGPLWWFFVSALIVVLLVGVPITLVARRRARTSLERTKLSIIAAGFVTYNLLVAATVVRFIMGDTLAGRPDRVIEFMNFIGLAAIQFMLVAMLGYGALKAQLFDIELRMKWTLRQGTVAAIVLATAFVASELAATLLSERMGPVLGILAAGLLVFAIAPLQRFGERLSDRAMPHVRDTPDYRDKRAREIYAAAIESALLDGVITDKERDVLASLAEQFGLSHTEARAIERGVVAAAGGAT